MEICNLSKLRSDKTKETGEKEKSSTDRPNIKQFRKHIVHKLRTDPPQVQTIMKVLLLHRTIIICKIIMQNFVEGLVGLQSVSGQKWSSV